MPTAPRRHCATCQATHHGPCPAKRSAYNQLRGSAHARGYTKWQHVPWRMHVLAKSLHVCVGYPYGKATHHPLTPATVADHIVPLVVWAADPLRAQATLLATLRARGLESERWLINFAEQWSFDYREMIGVASNPDDGRDWITAHGRDLHSADELGEDLTTFWQHMSVLTGRVYDATHQAKVGWSCTC